MAATTADTEPQAGRDARLLTLFDRRVHRLPADQSKRPSRHPISAAEVATRVAAVKGDTVLTRGGGFWVRCPCPDHPDRNPSLEVRAGRHQPVVLKCWSHPGGDWRSMSMRVVSEILSLAGLTSGDVLGPAHDGDVWVVSYRCPDHPQAGELLSDLHGHLRATSLGETALSLRDREVGSSGRGLPVLLPVRAGKVMRAVLVDVLDVVNARVRAGEQRSVPYASRPAAQRLGLDDRRVREAVEALVKAGALIRDGELPRQDGRNLPGTPCFRVAVAFPCALCAGWNDPGPELALVEADEFPDRYLVFCEDDDEPALLEAAS